MKITKIIWSIFILILLIGCAQNQNTLNAVIIQNKTPTTVYNIRLHVPETGVLVQCSSIPSGRDCALGFPEKKHEAHAATLSWQQDSYTYTKELKGDNLIKTDTERPLHAVVNIFDRGQLEAHMEQ